MLTEYFRIGKFVAAFGLEGELLLKHNLGKKTALKGLAAVFIEEKKESFIPWFIESTRVKTDDEIYIKLEGLTTREKALKLTPKEVWLTETDFKKFADKSSPINLLGYSIVEDGTELGKILEVIEQPHQVLCCIQYKEKEAYIPLHAETLLQIDHKKQKVTVALPPGLLEIFL